MPLTSTTNKTLTSALVSKSFDVSGVNIVLDEDTPAVVIRMRAFDTAGVRIKEWAITVPLADVAQNYASEYAAIRDTIKPLVYQIAQDQGALPSGTVS